MRVLLDTHCWLWMRTAPERFSAPARSLLRDPENELLFSAASSWEIAIKWALGKLPLPESPAAYVSKRIAEDGLAALSISHAHALEVSSLPAHHTDPFDRVLIAQSRLEGVPFLTVDRQLAPYDVELLWADGELQA